MEASLTLSRRDLATAEIISVSRANGWTIRCELGSAWLTLEGHSQDKMLAPGEDFVISGTGKLLVEAPHGARIALQPPPAGRFVVGLRAVLQRLDRLRRGAARASLYSPARVHGHC